MSTHGSKFDWKPDCGGDWVLDGPNYFACYWPDNTWTASVWFDGDRHEDDADRSSAPAIAGKSRAHCMAAAEAWIREQLSGDRRTGRVTVAELIEQLSGMAGGRDLYVSVQGVARPLQRVWVESTYSDEPGPNVRVVLSDGRF